MTELHKFLFDGAPVRGALVRLTDGWQALLQRRQAAGGYPAQVVELLGEMTAAAVLLQSNIKFAGAIVLQIVGDGPVKVAVAEVQPDMAFRATASVRGSVTPGARLPQLVNVHGGGRCAITLDPRERQLRQQPYQGIVPLCDAQGRPWEQLSDALDHYMRQSEQLETQWVLAADDAVAAGLLIQRMPVTGQSHRAGTDALAPEGDAPGASEDFNRIATLAASLTRQELLRLDADSILHRLFWQENLQRLTLEEARLRPRFACNCSRERVAAMLRSLGVDEVKAILAEQPVVEVSCDFCGQRYRFDAVDAAQCFVWQDQQPPGSDRVQ